MNNSSMELIEYYSKFVITDVTNLVMVVGILVIIVGLIYLWCKKSD